MKSQLLSLITLLGFSFLAQAQGISKSFSAPQKPSYLSVQAPRGSVIVVGSDEAEIFSIVGKWPRDLMQEPLRFEVPHNGRKPGSSDGFSISESGNKMKLKFNPKNSSETLYVRVPMDVNLKISASGKGSVLVRGTAGEIEVECLQGKLYLDRIHGPVVVHTLNDDLEAKFSGLVPEKPNFLSSLNGDIKLLLPTDSEVSFELDFFNGEVESPMPITLLPAANKKGTESDFEAPSNAETARKATHFRIKTHNGNISIKDYK
jgi:hypothetical protein